MIQIVCWCQQLYGQLYANIQYSDDDGMHDYLYTIHIFRHGESSTSGLAGRLTAIAASNGVRAWTKSYTVGGTVALIYNECWGVTATNDGGYAVACGAGIEDCRGSRSGNDCRKGIGKHTKHNLNARHFQQSMFIDPPRWEERMRRHCLLSGPSSSQLTPTRSLHVCPLAHLHVHPQVLSNSVTNSKCSLGQVGGFTVFTHIYIYIYINICVTFHFVC